MKIRELQPWQLKLASFALAWWLFLAPSATRWMWPQLTSAPMPAPLNSILSASGLWLTLGFVVAMGALSSDYKERVALQTGAKWFLLGTFTWPILAALLAP